MLRYVLDAVDHRRICLVSARHVLASAPNNCIDKGSDRTLSGIALRQCTDLGLHRDAARVGSGASLLETQLQRRVFWVAYNLDRIAAISTGRPFGIAEEDIDAEVGQSSFLPFFAHANSTHSTRSTSMMKTSRSISCWRIQGRTTQPPRQSCL